MVEVIGRWSNHADQGERLRVLATIVPSGSSAPIGRTPKQVQRRLRPAEIDEVIAGYKGGLTVYELAHQFRIHRVTVANLLKRSGLLLRGQSLTAAQVTDAVSLYDSGLPLTRVAAVIGCSSTTVWNTLRAEGVKLRGPHERARF